jgi:hypothetical protein
MNVTVNLTGIDERLLLNFFCAFSRFECALKRAGFAKGDEHRVDPDWGCFGKTLLAHSSEELAPVFKFGQYLIEKPPQKQTLTKGRLGWTDTADGSVSEIERLLLSVRRVRNNLFHGGKYPEPVGPVPDAARNTELLHCCIDVLAAVLDLPGARRVKNEFVDADV